MTFEELQVAVGWDRRSGSYRPTDEEGNMIQTIEHRIERQKSYRGATFGSWYINDVWACYTLEDQIREIPGIAVEIWKVHGMTAIPSGRYLLTLAESLRFGAETITISGVPGFSGIRVHGGNTTNDTEGCPLVGSKCDREACRISGAVADGVLAKLKEKIKGLQGQHWITVVNPSP